MNSTRGFTVSLACVAIILMTISPAAAESGTRLDNADHLIATLEYEQARDLLVDVLSDEGLTDAERVRANLALGIVSRILERDVDARIHFVRALSIDPYARLPDGQPPKIQLFFSLIQKEVREDIRERKRQRFEALQEAELQQQRDALRMERQALAREKKESEAALERREEWLARRDKARLALEARSAAAAASAAAEEEVSSKPVGVSGVAPAVEEKESQGSFGTITLLATGVMCFGIVLAASGIGLGGTSAAFYAWDKALFDNLGVPLIVGAAVVAPVSLVLMSVGGGFLIWSFVAE